MGQLANRKAGDETSPTLVDVPGDQAVLDAASGAPTLAPVVAAG